MTYLRVLTAFRGEGAWSLTFYFLWFIYTLIQGMKDIEKSIKLLLNIYSDNLWSIQYIFFSFHCIRITYQSLISLPIFLCISLFSSMHGSWTWKYKCTQMLMWWVFCFLFFVYVHAHFMKNNLHLVCHSGYLFQETFKQIWSIWLWNWRH